MFPNFPTTGSQLEELLVPGLLARIIYIFQGWKLCLATWHGFHVQELRSKCVCAKPGGYWTGMYKTSRSRRIWTDMQKCLKGALLFCYMVQYQNVFARKKFLLHRSKWNDLRWYRQQQQLSLFILILQLSTLLKYCIQTHKTSSQRMNKLISGQN